MYKRYHATRKQTPITTSTWGRNQGQGREKGSGFGCRVWATPYLNFSLRRLAAAVTHLFVSFISSTWHRDNWVSAQVAQRQLSTKHSACWRYGFSLLALQPRPGFGVWRGFRHQIMRNVARGLVALQEAELVVDGNSCCVSAGDIEVRARKCLAAPVERLKEQHVTQTSTALRLGHKHLQTKHTQFRLSDLQQTPPGVHRVSRFAGRRSTQHRMCPGKGQGEHLSDVE
jgi:hypothetical protein